MKCEYLEVQLEVPKKLMPPGEPMDRLKAVVILLGGALVGRGVAIDKIKFRDLEQKGGRQAWNS